MFDLVGKRYLWFGISLLLIIPGLIFLLIPGGGLRVGIDFSGGTLWEFAIPNRSENVPPDEVATVFEQQDIEITTPVVSPPDDRQQVLVTVRSREVPSEDPRRQQVADSIAQTFPGAELTRFETVGGTVSRESTQQAFLAVIAASAAILAYLTLAFRKAPNPIRFGVCAILAMLHDVLVVIGAAAILGYFIGLEVDALFLTAVLTVISFSVHDTIVVFDRVRENLSHRRTGQSFEDLVNLAVMQTLTRSINTQMTSFLTLLALLLYGGASIRNFVLILLIGLLSGTYSSIFNAAQLLVVWEHGWLNDWRHYFGREEPVAV